MRRTQQQRAHPPIGETRECGVELLHHCNLFFLRFLALLFFLRKHSRKRNTKEHAIERSTELKTIAKPIPKEAAGEHRGNEEYEGNDPKHGVPCESGRRYAFPFCKDVE